MKNIMNKISTKLKKTNINDHNIYSIHELGVNKKVSQNTSKKALSAKQNDN